MRPPVQANGAAQLDFDRIGMDLGFLVVLLNLQTHSATQEPGSNGLQGRLPAAVFAPRHLGRTHDQAQAPADMAPPEP